MNTVKVGLVSTSWFAELVHIPSIQSHAGAELVSICGRNRENAQDVAEKYKIPKVYTDYRAQIDSNELDAIVIASPDDMHYEMVVYALEAGMHVLCEKPMASNVEQARHMVNAAEKAGVVHMVNFSWRWMPMYQFVRDLVGEGVIGKPNYLNIHYQSSHGLELQGWRFDADRAAGVLGDLGAHILHISTLLGGKIADVSAILSAFVAPQEAQEIPANPANNSACLLLKYATGMHGMMHASASTHLGARGQVHSLEISGSEATLTGMMDMSGSDEVTCVRKGSESAEELCVPDVYWSGVDRTKEKFEQIKDLLMTHPVGARAFIEAIQNGFTDYPDFKDGLHVQEVIDAALKSDVEGRSVPVG